MTPVLSPVAIIRCAVRVLVGAVEDVVSCMKYYMADWPPDVTMARYVFDQPRARL